MLEVQKPMLIEAAKNFEAAINQQDKAIAWSNVAALEAYIQRLQAAATELTTRNRKLRAAHDQLIEMTLGLFSVDLVRQRDKWKDGLREMRKIVEDLQVWIFCPKNSQLPLKLMDLLFKMNGFPPVPGLPQRACVVHVHRQAGN